MVFGPIFQRILEEAKEEAERKRRSPYWVVCPGCGRRVVQKELIKKGCYACGWRGTEEELELAKTKSVSQPGKVSNLDKRASQNLYRTNCPNCGAEVITQQLQEKGCYICGWKDSGQWPVSS